MFGPELKNITGESKSLNEVLRLVDMLFNPLKSSVSLLSLDPFLILLFQSDNFENLSIALEFALSLLDEERKVLEENTGRFCGQGSPH